MSGSTFGVSFRVTTAGESHGPGYVTVIDGCPAGLELSEADLVPDLERRRPGQSEVTTARAENDEPRIVSGVYRGRTTGAPIAVWVESKDVRSGDYAALEDLYRPGHADYSFEAKYGFRDARGGGRASARETLTRVVAGGVARKLMSVEAGVEVVGWVAEVGGVIASVPTPEEVRREAVEWLGDGRPNVMRCPDASAALAMAELVEKVRGEGDSVGGVSCVCATGVPAGLGEPVFDKLKADLAKALFSIPAVVGVELGIGFAAARLRGSEVNDELVMSEGRVRSATNHHGGILGGISTGMPIFLRAAVKPPSSIAIPQRTVTRDGAATVVEVRGRHDPCLLPRFVPVAEAMVLLVLADHWLRDRGSRLRKG
ncbi:MAG: chorismate synthase [Deltaproteobacteria bacterium]|nr:chorismate synthase [Deltaproteobacteria bacterium]